MSDKSQQFCKDRHDTLIIGRNKAGVCKQCKQKYQEHWLQKNLITQQKYWSDYYFSNKELIQDRTKRYRQSNKVKVKEMGWKYRHIINSDGLPFTQLDYDRLYQIQSGKCAICKKHQTELQRSFDVDHDHKTGFVRGLLCYNCNQGLGNFKDNLLNLKESTNYLKNHLNGGSL